MSKKNRAALRRSLLTLSLVLVVAFAAVGGTLAWLTADTTVVTNTFTLGKVEIDLDESKVNEYGDVDTSATARVKENTYKLLPGELYTKDPEVHVKAGSEKCYLFIKIDNQLSDLEATGTTSIAAQLTANKWTALPGVENVYYYNEIVDARTAAKDVKVFESFKLKDDLSNTTITNAAGKTIKIDAYAVQADNIADAPTAWTKASTTWGN